MQMASRHLDRCGTMTRSRGLDPADGEAIHPEPKRRKVPALASVIVEALKMDSLQKLCSTLEPVLRRVVSEEVERALAKLGPARLIGRSSPKQIEGPDGRNLQLHFRSRLSMPLYTGGKVEGEQGAAIHVVLIDAKTGNAITSGPESSAKLDVVVLEGDFNNEDDDWTQEEFETHMVKEREGKGPLLTGDLQISLKEGVGTLGELTFTDNSSWIRSRKFRLGLRIASGFCEGIRVREAKTEAFMVKDHRGELYKKHFPPALKDEVWRLEKIGKDGSFHKKLNRAGIYTVEDFLRVVVRDPQRLRKILGSSMSNKMWEVLVEHAKTCVLSGKHYVYFSDHTRSVGAIFNNIYEFTGLITGGQYYSGEYLTDSQKIFADSLVKRAYDNWMHVVEYDGKVLLNFKEGKKSTASRKEPPSGAANHPTSYDQQVCQQQSSVTAAIDQPAFSKGTAGGMSTGRNGNQVSKYSSNHQHTTPNGHTHIQITALPQNQLLGVSQQSQASSNNGVELVLSPLQQASAEFQPLNQPIQPANFNSYAVDNYFTEEEIRLRSHEILQNEDMQHLLRAFSLGGASAMHEDGYGFSSFMPSPCPNFNFNEDRSRPSGRAYAGWLKIKAAMRWGIFIRKKAAERRAQLVELDD